MKFINLLALFFVALFFTACASTDESAAAADTDAAADTAESKTTDTEGLLMDRYKSGEIAGYRD